MFIFTQLFSWLINLLCHVKTQHGSNVYVLLQITTVLLYCSFADLGIDKSIFIKPKTFHLTVLMLKLWNKERIKTASEVLQVNCGKFIIIYYEN